LKIKQNINAAYADKINEIYFTDSFFILHVWFLPPNHQFTSKWLFTTLFIIETKKKNTITITK